MRLPRFVLVALIASAILGLDAGAQQPTPQYRVPSLSDLTGLPGLSLAVRKLTTIGSLMQMTAHPDDEPNSTLTLYARHVGARVTLVTATRGDGGQNEIGTELFDALGVLRTEELLAAHRFDGAEQYFTRAVDFGYSFSTQETFEKWGHEEVLGDFVRHIRTIRPDVIMSMSPEGTGGGQHHQASAMLAAEAFRAAGDPTKFPEQIREGLRPWQAKKLYRPAGGFGGGRGGGRGARGAAPAQPAPPADGTFATLDTNIYEPLLGCTIAEVGSVASGMHICQGRAPLVPPPGPGGGGGFGGGGRLRLADTTLTDVKKGDETSVFEGLDISLAALARYAGAQPPAALTSALTTIASRVDVAKRAVESGSAPNALPELLAGLTAVRDLLGRLDSIGLTDDGKYEIGRRVRLKEEQFQSAIMLAQGLRIDATANDGVIVAGQPLSVTVAVSNRGPGQVAVRGVALIGFDGPRDCAAGTATTAQRFDCTLQVHVPRDAKLTDVYWNRPEDAGRATFAPDAPFGLPFRPSPFRVEIEMDIANTRVSQNLPVQFRYAGDEQAGEKRMELNVVPAFAVSVSPRIAVLPLHQALTARTAGKRLPPPETRELRVTVVNGTKGAATATVTLKVPTGWRLIPPSAPVTFSREDESTTTRFTLVAPAALKAGEVDITAEASAKADATDKVETFDQGYQVIEYPHIQRRQKVIPAHASVKVLDVTLPAPLSVGYIMGVGDQVPAALQQLGAKVTMIDSDELAWRDLSHYDVIVAGVRAYERRADLRANNHRLLKYVEDGGTAIVQYSRQEFNQAQYGPYQAEVSQERITDEHAPVKVLVATHPIFTFPNRITNDDWKDWVQERGTYFLGARDAKYTDLIEMTDPFEFNPGPKRGALVEARYGKGRWVYVGLGLWRQLPSGTDGAYRIFANLISLGRAK